MAAAFAETNPKVTLGQALFFDKRLSGDGTIACANCHDPAHAYADTRTTGIGIGGAKGARNTPSLLNTKYYTRWGWDGRNQVLENQMIEPLLSSTEHGFATPGEVTKTIRDTPDLASRYAAAFGVGAPYTMQHVGEALADYIRSLPPPREKASQENSRAAAFGRQLFVGKAGCSACHLPSAGFTDNQFHLRYQGAVAIDDSMAVLVNRVRLHTLSRKYLRTADPAQSSIGAMAHTLDPNDIGKFRTPSLMHVAQTAPYMHDGSISTLRDAIIVELKVRRPGMQFDATEIDALHAFLGTLNN